MFISVCPPLGVSGSLFKFRQNLTCIKRYSYVAAVAGTWNTVCMSGRTLIEHRLCLRPFVHMRTTTMTLYFCSYACKWLWMLQDLLKIEKRCYDVRGSERGPIPLLKQLSKATEDRDSSMRGIGLDALHEQLPIRIEHLRLLKEDRQGW